MDQRVQIGGLSVAAQPAPVRRGGGAARFGRRAAGLLGGLDAIVHDLAPRNRELLARRDELQSRIDDWHREHPGTPDAAAYTAFLREIGYLLDEPDEVAVTTADVDDEVARIAGPQLVVPAAQRAVRHQRGQRPVGLALRRALRLRRGPARGRPRARRGLQQGPRRRGHRPRPGPPRRALPAGVRLARRRLVVRRGRRRPRRHGQGRRAPARRPRRSWSATAATPSRPRRCSWSTTGCTSRSRSTATTRSAPPTAPASRTCWSRPRSPRSWTSRTRSPPSTPRTRCSATATGSG